MTAPVSAGLHYDMPAAVYHADPTPGGASLSLSRAKVLLTEAGPAKFRHRETTPVKRPEFDMGNAAHAYALGKDADRIVIVEEETWRKASAQQARKAAWAEGKTPLLPKEKRQAEDMAAELSKHPLAMESLTGTAEVSMFHQRDDGLWLRGRMDLMADGWTTDYKTTTDASSYGFTKQSWSLRYYMQAAWYRRMRGWLTGDWLPYRLVAQEKTAPYLVSVWEVDAAYLEQGAQDMDEAIDIYLACVKSGTWPGYPNEIQTLTPFEWTLDDEIEIGD